MVGLPFRRFRKCSKGKPSLFCWIYFLYIYIYIVYIVWIYVLKIILRRWGIENYTFFIIKQHPNLILNFIYVKKHEMEITLNFLILKDGTLNFFILKKGNPKT